jgi:hypothetical protein
LKYWMKKAPYLLFLLVIPLLAQIYELLNNRNEDAIDISTSVDQSIPFLPIFIIPYIIWYGYIFLYLIYFWFKNTKVYLKTLLIIAIGEIICFMIYFFFQTTVLRPEVTEDYFLNQLVKWIYHHDEPFNCFPSIHVLTTFAIMLGSLHIKEKHVVTTIFTHLVGTLIIVSTLFVKQHVIFDMISSVFLVAFLYGFMFEIQSFRLFERAETIYIKNKS